MANVLPSDLSIIITDPNGAEVLVKEAENVGKLLATRRGALTTSQIRSIFGEVRQIQAQWGMGAEIRQRATQRLILLKPKMAYKSRRDRTGAVQELVDVLRPALDKVIEEKNAEKQDANFKRFVEFFEAILAYHKAHGGN